MSDLASQNQRRSATLLGLSVGVIAVIVAAVLVLAGFAWVGVVVAGVVAGLAGLAAYRTADLIVLRASGATPADAKDPARLYNLVEGLCIANGLPEPSLYVVDEPAANAFAVGRSPRHASLVVTTGLLDTLDRIELEAVLAQQLSHIKNNDIAVSTLAASVLRWPLGIGATRSRVIDPERTVRADLAAVEMTRFPPGLIGALEKIRSDPATVERAPQASTHLWFAPPLSTGQGRGGSASPLPFLEDRLAVLREL